MITRSFTATYDDIYDDDNLTGNEKFHLDILHRFYNKEKGYAHPSLKQIMKKASSKNENQTRKVLNSLGEKGYIKIVAKVGIGTRYYLLKNYIVITGNNDSTSKYDRTSNNDSGSTGNNDSKPLAKLIDKKEYINNNKNNNIDTSKKASKNKGSNLTDLIENYTSNNELKDTIIDFLEMRKIIKSPITDRGLKGILNKIDKLANEDSEKIEILEQSIMNSWKGVFPLKENQSKAYNPQENQGPKYDQDGYEII